MSKTKNTSNEEFEAVEFEKIGDDSLEFEKLEGVEYEDDKAPVTPKELTDEIREFRQKNKEFQATNDHETYLVVVFSTKEDKEEFLKGCDIDEHTLIDGYALAKSVGKQPVKPKYLLKKPLNQ